MTSRQALLAAMLCVAFPSAAAADSFRDDPHDGRFFFELELDAGVGPQLRSDSALVGHLAARTRFGIMTATSDSDEREAMGNSIALEVPVHVWFNARRQGTQEAPDVAIGLAPRAYNELVDGRFRVPALISIAMPEFGVFIPTDGSEVNGYVGWSYTFTARLNDEDDDVNVALETRLSAYLLFTSEDEDDVDAVGSLSLGLTVY